MTVVTIKKVDETTISVDSDTKGVLNELSDFFSFYAPGYRYDKRFQNHIWDGRIRLVNIRSSTAPQGLTSNIIKFCSDRGYQFVDETEKHLLPVQDDLSNFDQWIEDLNLPFAPRDYQLAAVKQAIRANKTLLVSATGCHAKGTRLLIADGSTKPVESIEVGDRLIGPDGTTRRVLKITHGTDTMVRITDRANRFEPFVVNSEHVLHLFDTNTNQFVDVAVDYYIKYANQLSNTHRLVANCTPIEFDNCGQQSIDSYSFGHSDAIPESLKRSSVNDRLQLIGSFVDRFGMISDDRSSYQLMIDSSRLASDLVDVIRSVGLVVSRNGNQLTIVGNISTIQSRRFKGPFNEIDNCHLIPFDVEVLDRDQYYGVYTDQDHLYLDSNYIVHHNSGKSLIQYLIVRWMLERDRKVCMIVPSTSLVEQMLSDFADYSKLNKWDVNQNIKGLYSKIKTTDPYQQQCVISTWQSICRYDNQLFESWDCVIVDECHGAKSAILSKILSGSINARFKIGLTGTLANTVCHEFQLTGLFGSPFIVATTKQLQDKGQLSKMKIYMVVMKYPPEECKQVWNDVKTLKKTYNDEIDYINNHPKRQLFIRNLVCSLKGTTLILFRMREHGEQLYKLIKDKVGDSRLVFHIDGKIDAKTREQIRNAADANKDCILVFSVATSATGINIKSIENLIINPSKSKIQTLQSIGRSLRLCEGKDGAKVFDLVDDLSTGRHKNYLVKHSMERYQVYCDQGFDVEFKQVEFK